MNLLKISIIFFTFLLGFFNSSISYGAINFEISPLGYELKTETGATITKSAQIRNKGTETVTLRTSKSDFEANGTTGIPRFIRRSELVYPDQVLSSWITLSESEVTLAPSEAKTISFTINVPNNATPGGHYGAVIFKNDNSLSPSSGSDVSINVDYAVLIILKVEGKIEVDIVVDPIVITNTSSGDGGGPGGGSSGKEKDSCPFGDLTSSNYDGKCIDKFSFNGEEDNLESGEIISQTTTGDTNDSGNNNNSDNNTDGKNNIADNNNELEEFQIDFNLPINNNGNTHVKPTGTISLIDEDGNQIKGIGKEIETNEFGAVIGEKIVNYLPINDGGGNVLPNTKRNYNISWRGFPYKDYDDSGNLIVKYWSPGAYYTNKNIKENKFLMFWERVCDRRNHKTITALIEIKYKDENGEDVFYNAAEEFDIEYDEQYIGINPYIIIPLLFFIIFLFFTWIIAFKRKRICINIGCSKKLKTNMAICPYCGEKQKKKISKIKKEKELKKKKTSKKEKESKKKKK